MLLGVIWACWQLPLFFIPGIDKSGQSFPVYVLQVTALSVAAAWLCVHTNGSLLLVMLMHSAVNQTIGIVPSTVATATNSFALSTSLVAWLTVACLWIGAGYFLIRMPKATIGDLCAELLQRGLSPDHPAVAVFNVTRADEVVLSATITTLPECIAQASSDAPCIVLIGDAVGRGVPARRVQQGTDLKPVDMVCL